MENRYAAGFTKLSSSMKIVAKAYNTSYYKLMYDAAKCFFLYGVTPNEYIVWEFYRLSHLER